jgi:hypothetical protein
MKNMSNNNRLIDLIDNLPNDILLKCANYICLPPSSLLKEIEHYGNIKKSLKYLKLYDINTLYIIHYKLLKKWYYIYAKNMISEFEGEHEAVITLVSSYNLKNEMEKEIIYFIKKLMMIIPSNIVNNIVMRYKYNHTL